MGSCSVCICLFVLFHVLLLTMNYPVENENEIFVLHLVLFSCLTVKNFIYTAQVDNTVLLNLHFWQFLLYVLSTTLQIHNTIYK